MVRLIVVRHAESQWNPIGRYQGLLDPELTERGKKQAHVLAKELEKENISCVYTSPLRRTYQTAEIISERLGVPLHKDGKLIEIDHGKWSGLLVEEVRERYPDEFEIWLKEPHKAVFDGGESLKDVFERVKDFLSYVRENHQHETIAVVSHTVPIRCMYCAVLGIELSRFWSFGCDNASYSVVVMEEDRSIIQKLNITCHLGDLYVEAHRAL